MKCSTVWLCIMLPIGSLLAAGGLVHARLPSVVGDKFREGDRVHIHYAPSRLLVFPEPKDGLKKELEME